MLPRFYQAHLQTQLSPNQYILLNLLTELLQWQKQVRLERLASNPPLPIQFESRRQQLQRFLVCPQLRLQPVWFGIINYLLAQYFVEIDCCAGSDPLAKPQSTHGQSALASTSYPIVLAVLPHPGNSNFSQQQALLQTVLPLLKAKTVVVLGDREFCSVELGQWLGSQKLVFCLRLRHSGVHSYFSSNLSTAQSGWINTWYVCVFCRGKCYPKAGLCSIQRCLQMAKKLPQQTHLRRMVSAHNPDHSKGSNHGLSTESWHRSHVQRL